MKILYAIQGTGNGHISRAREIIPILRKNNDVDILISGTQADVQLPWPVKYSLEGLSFIFGKKGGVDIWETYKKSNLRKLYKDIQQLDVEPYDIVLNDFEPVSAWACYFKNKPCISLSHQSAVMNKHSPQPQKFDPVGKTVLKRYAPVTAKYGFHFKKYAENIFTPVIRSEIRCKNISEGKHFTVYLPAYSDERILKVLKECNEVKWEVFSKHCTETEEKHNIIIQPIENTNFINSLSSAAGVLCGAGFETPAEALFMRKKLMVIPMKGQYEQQCNAEALHQMGVPVLKSLKKKHIVTIRNWIIDSWNITVDYPDETASILETILQKHSSSPYIPTIKKIDSFADFQKKNFKNIIKQLGK